MNLTIKEVNKLKLLLTAVVFIAFTSCTTKIKTIFTKIEKYDGKEVKIKGKVESPTNLLLTKYYFVNDLSGKKIRVVTPNALPVEGMVTKVKGRVVQRFKIADFQWVVLKENDENTEEKE